MREPKKLTSKRERQFARNIRDGQWRFMERVAEHGKIWWCIWNKDRREEASNEQRDSLMTGMERQEWMNKHRGWFKVGRWNERRYARSVRLTEEGKKALANRRHYDMEPVTGGLVEPGWITIPARR